MNTLNGYSKSTLSDKYMLTAAGGHRQIYDSEFIIGTQTAATGSWTGVSVDSALYDGKQISYWLPFNGSGNATLNLTLAGGTTTGAVNCYYGGTSRLTTHYGAGNVIRLVYRKDVNIGGTNYTGWWADANYVDGNTYTAAWCGTAAATAAKTASCTNFTLKANSYIHILIRYSNTAASAITLNVNSQGAKPIYINGKASSSSNYTLPAGTYLVFYDGTNFYFRTDKVLPGTIETATQATKSEIARYIECPDTRSTTIDPTTLNAANGVMFDFKQKSVTGLAAAYSGIMTFRPYSNSTDWSGGPAHQLAFDANGLHHRTASSATWGNWSDLLTTSNYPTLISGYVTSSTASLSSYWAKLWDATWTSDDLDITFYIHSAYGDQRGLVHLKARRNSSTTDGVTTYNFACFLKQITGNLTKSRFRLYYEATSGKLQLWADCNGRWGVYNCRIISCTSRVGQERLPIVGTLYTTSFTAAQTLPTDSYVELTNVREPDYVTVNQHTTNNVEYPLVWSNENNTSTKTSNQLYKSYAHLTYNPSAQRITVGNISSGGVLTLNGVSGVYLKTNNTDSASVVLSSEYFKPFDVANNKLSLGTTSARWSNVYSVLGNYSGVVTGSSTIQANRFYLRYSGSTGVYADLQINTRGTKCTTEGTAGTTGVSYLLLGNNTAVSTTLNSGAENACGILRLYGTNTGYTDIRCGTQNTSGYTLYLPGATGQFVVHTNDTAVGSASIPIYIAATGVATACTISDGSGDVDRKLLVTNGSNGIYSTATITGNYATGNLISTRSGENPVRHTCTNGVGSVSLLVHSNRGLYDSGNSYWMIYSAKDTTSVYIPKWASKGSSTQPVYFNSAGEPAACTAYTGLLTALSSTSATNLSITVGGTTKTVADMWATNIANKYSSRPTTIDPGITGDGSMFHFKCTSSVTDSATDPGDGHILHFNWDNTGGYDAQLWLADSATTAMKIRGMTTGTWGNWATVLTSINYTSYLGYIGTTAVQSSSAAQALTGITNITMTGNILVNAENNDRYLIFSYSNQDRHSWRIGYTGTGTGDANYLVIQGTGQSSGGAYINALCFTNGTNDAGFGGNVYPLVDNTKTLGTSSLKWSAVYATTLVGKISLPGGSYSWYQVQQYNSSNANPSYYAADCAAINFTSYSGWQPWIRGVDSEKGSWTIGQYTTNLHIGYIPKSNTTNALTYSWNFGKDGSTLLPGSVTSLGHLTLKTSGTGDSPRLIFERNGLDGTSGVDWSIYDAGGNLYFQHCEGSGWVNTFQLNYSDNTATLVGNITAAGFVKSGSSNSYVLLGGGSHKAVGNASGNIPLSNGTVCTNLNADTLDGFHKNDILETQWNPTIDLNTLYAKSGFTETSYNNAGSANITNLPFTSKATTIITTPGRYGFQIAHQYDSATLFKIRGFYNDTFYAWKTLAFTDSDITGNAGSATKVYINNSSGNGIYPVIFTNTASCGTPRNDSLYVDSASGVGYNPSTNAFVGSIMTAGTHNSTSTLYLNSGSSTTSIIFGIGGTEKVRIAQPNGYLGINTTTITYPLTVNGVASATRFIASGTNQYKDAGGLVMNNSDIWGLNAIYTADLADGAGEGYQFKRSNGNYDSVWSADGTFYYSPNGNPDSGYGTNYVVIHSGNYTSYTVKKDGTGASGTWNININGSSEYIYSHDTRNNTISPNTYGNGFRCHFQANGTNGVNDGGNYYGLLHIKHYGGKDDHSGGYPHQIAFTPNNNLWHRIGTSATGWGSWIKILDSNNYSGTLDTRYVKKSGDTMTGALTLSYAASATMTYNSTNPQIVFAESGTQPVKLIYTDYDSYRAPAGLKVIGSESGAWFEVHGNCYAAHFYENSDIKLKTNIEAITTSSNIPQLKSFDWKSDGSHSYGLIAQELEEMGYSELVDSSGEHKTVKYSAALSLIVGKLQVKIKELEKEIEQLKNK